MRLRTIMVPGSTVLVETLIIPVQGFRMIEEGLFFGFNPSAMPGFGLRGGSLRISMSDRDLCLCVIAAGVLDARARRRLAAGFCAAQAGRTAGRSCATLARNYFDLGG
jgi:hypothetical protein